MSVAEMTSIAIKLVPIVVLIAKEVLDKLTPEQRTPEVEACLTLFNAMIAYLEIAE